MTVSIWQANGQQPVESTDVAIIGAGLTGCAAAIFLRQMGKQVALIDANDIGLGASSRNAGFMLTGLDKYYHHAEATYGPALTREIWQLSKQTHAFWRQVAQRHQVSMQDCGSLLLAESEPEAIDLAAAARSMEINGFDCEYLSTDPLNRGYHAALRQVSDGSIHPAELVDALYKESEARLIINSEVYAIESAADAVHVRSRRAIVHAQQVLICTNAYAGLLDDYFQDKIIPTRAQCLATAPLPTRILDAVSYSDYGYMYYRQALTGELIIGGGRKQNVVAEDDTIEDRTTGAVQSVLEHYLRSKFPDVTVPIVRRWAGIMGFTPDGLPIVGTLPRDGRIAFAVGFNGHGLGLGAAVAERAVDLLIHRTDPTVFSVYRLKP